MTSKKQGSGKPVLKGSGKQVLSRILAELSTKKVRKKDFAEATRRLRAGLLLHGSSSDYMYDAVNRLVWATARDCGGHLDRQGIATENGSILISDIFECIWQSPKVKKHVLQKYSDLDADDFEAAMLAIWLVISSVQMFAWVNSIETKTDNIDVDAWVEYMMRQYDCHFREEERRKEADHD
jgi:hypothetical protein